MRDSIVFAFLVIAAGVEGVGRRCRSRGARRGRHCSYRRACGRRIDRILF